MQVEIAFEDIFSKSAEFAYAYNEDCYKDGQVRFYGDTTFVFSEDNFLTDVDHHGWLGNQFGHIVGEMYQVSGYYFIFIGSINDQDIQVLRYIR